MALLIISPFVVAAVAAWLGRRWPHRTAMLALWPAALTLAFADELVLAMSEGGRLVELPWAPSLGLTLSFNLDALGLVFAMLIAGVGALVVVFSSG